MKRFLTILTALIIVSFLFQPNLARADGSFFLSPNSASYAVGSTFTTNLVVGTGGQTINAGQGTITFSTDLLEATSVSWNGSIFTLWPVTPTSSSNQVSFAGGLPTPGYSGNGGLILSITWRAKAVGTATVSVSSGQLLLDDGLGTNILTGYGTASYIITESAPTEEPTEPEQEEEEEVEKEEAEKITVPPIPKILSNTHPKQTAWYNNNSPEFTWDKLEGITDSSYVFDDQVDTQPDDISEGSANTVVYTDVDNGIWYFHVKVRNEAGWSQTGHFKVQIDVTPPLDFEVTPQAAKIFNNRNPYIFFQTSDITSGLSHYEILVDGQLVDTISAEDQTLPYQLEFLDFGKHDVTVRAFDRASNMTESTTIFHISKYYPGTGFWIGSIYILYSWIVYLLVILLLIALILIVLLYICCFKRKSEKKTTSKKKKKNSKK